MINSPRMRHTVQEDYYYLLINDISGMNKEEAPLHNTNFEENTTKPEFSEALTEKLGLYEYDAEWPDISTAQWLMVYKLYMETRTLQFTGKSNIKNVDYLFSVGEISKY